MNDLSSNPAFTAYAITTILLCFNVLALWGYSGGVRAGTKTCVNPEDALTVSKGAAVREADPAAVARVIRAYNNAAANNLPFLAIGLVYVLLGASPTMAAVLFGSFTAFRLIHSVVYLREMQPWRTAAFALGGLVTLVMGADMVRLLVM
ncbi:MAG: MAPEG family protein [Pseudomonadota bacterium]|nr:MAPEG family protein [Pseudomonadota bacterium]